MARRPASPGQPRLTADALKHYVPQYQQGDMAARLLVERGAELSAAERNHAQAIAKLSELAAGRVAQLGGPLIFREISKLIAGSHLRTRENLFDMLYYAGMHGMKLGLRKFEVGKMNSSATNYLFQWITVYAKKELLSLEAPLGVPPARFQKYKKIAAIRKRLSENLGRPASNQEIYDYLQSGAADLKTMNGRVAKKPGISRANLAITLNLIAEQEEFERNGLYVASFDPLDARSAAIPAVSDDTGSFRDSLFGVFCAEYGVTREAEAVIMSELGFTPADAESRDILDKLSKNGYAGIAAKWKKLVKAQNGPFHEFLERSQDSGLDGAELALRAIVSHGEIMSSSSYSALFDERKVSAHA